MRAVATALVLLAGGHAVDAQPADKVPRIGFLYFGSGQSGVGADRYAAFLDGMRERGYIDGKTVAVEARFADSRAERVPGLADELMRLKVDLIVATGSPVYRVLQRMSVPVPVVVTVTADPLIEGLAASVARPGGNFTGLSDTAADLSLKQIELLRAVVPKLSRIGVLMNPDNRSHPAQVTRLMLASQKLGVQVVLAEAATVGQIDGGFASLVRERAHAAMMFGDTFFSQNLPDIARGALKHRLPSIYTIRDYAESGGLMSYGAPLIENFRRAATYVDKILKGAKPAQLPFEQPTNYRLFVNRKTARALGLAIPSELLVRADAVVE